MFGLVKKSVISAASLEDKLKWLSQYKDFRLSYWHDTNPPGWKANVELPMSVQGKYVVDSDLKLPTADAALTQLIERVQIALRKGS